MIPRQKELLKNLVEEYVNTAQPVSSKLMVEKYHLDISPATVRNDMAELEEQGLICSPHTSAGRIPTEHGYKYYIENHINKESKIDESKKIEFIESIKSIKTVKEDKVKDMAKVLAQESGLGVFIGFANNNVYYTGLSNIFSQPEFQDLDLVCSLSQVIDHLDEVMNKIYNDVTDLEIKIGQDNPFAHDCASVMHKINDILIGIIGPTRMDYQKNIELINFIKRFL